jgi:hypothetical protein
MGGMPTYPAQMPVDDRRWWVVTGGDMDPRYVVARYGRWAVAEFKRRLVKDMVADGETKTRALQWASVQDWTVSGPLTTAQAYHGARRAVLWDAVKHYWIAYKLPRGVQWVADDREGLVEVLGETWLERIEGALARRFADPETVFF